MSWPGKDAGPENLGSGGEEKGSQGPQCAGTVPGVVDPQGRVVAAAGGGSAIKGSVPKSSVQHGLSLFGTFGACFPWDVARQELVTLSCRKCLVLIKKKKKKASPPHQACVSVSQ